MSEKKQMKISLGNAIWIVIIVLLIAVIVGMYVYYNKDNELNNNSTKLNEIIKADEVIVEKNETISDDVTTEKNEIKNHEVVTEKNDEIISDNQKTFKEGTYVLGFSESGGGKFNNFFRFIAIQNYIKFYNGEFVSYLGDDYIIEGKYEKTENGKIKCYIKGSEYTIDFAIKNDNEIQVDTAYAGEWATEFSICLGTVFSEGNEFSIYNKDEFIGEWKSKTAGYYDEIGVRWEEEELRAILGTAYLQAGSTFTFNSDNTFKDYVFPVTEGNRNREGTYTFDGINKFTLKYYDEPSEEVEVYIMNKDTIVYKTENYMFFMSK
jgi:hypothetical protein